MVSKQNTHNQIYEEVNIQESCQISDKTGIEIENLGG
jgi:molybdenum cofactor biosynthesis enzyme